MTLVDHNTYCLKTTPTPPEVWLPGEMISSQGAKGDPSK